MPTVNIDVSAVADTNPYALNTATDWTVLTGVFKVASGSLRPTSSGMTSAAIAKSAPATGVLRTRIKLKADSNHYNDASSILFVNAAYTGYRVFINGPEIYINEITTGSTGTQVGYVVAAAFATGEEFEATYTIATDTLDVYQVGGVGGVIVPIKTVAALTYPAGMSDGFQVEYNDNNTGGVITVSSTSSAANSVDTITNPVYVGGTGYTLTTTGMGAITSLSFDGKACTITAASVGSCTFSIPTFANAVTYPQPGASHTFTASDGTLSATISRVVGTLATFTAVTMTDPLNTDEWSICQDTAIVDPDVVSLPTAGGVLNPNGTLGDGAGGDYVFGVYTMWRWEAATGTMYTSQLTVSQSGISFGGENRTYIGIGIGI